MVEFAALLERLRQDYPAIRFTAGQRYCWSPATVQVFYKRSHQHQSDPVAVMSLLHETGHALLGHERYRQDFELLELEAAAWERARTLAAGYGITLDEDHVQDCLDTYRDWLYRRSICPSCTSKALQLDDSPEYRCYNCHAVWRVAASRFCRPYRKSKAGSAAPMTVFASLQS